MTTDTGPAAWAPFLAARLAEDWRKARDDELAQGLDESRATRDINAKREILARHSGPHMCPEPQDDEWVLFAAGERVVRVYPCGDVRDLLAIYSDHPGYDQAWKR